MQFDKG